MNELYQQFGVLVVGKNTNVCDNIFWEFSNLVNHKLPILHEMILLLAAFVVG